MWWMMKSFLIWCWLWFSPPSTWCSEAHTFGCCLGKSNIRSSCHCCWWHMWWLICSIGSLVYLFLISMHRPDFHKALQQNVWLLSRNNQQSQERLFQTHFHNATCAAKYCVVTWKGRFRSESQLPFATCSKQCADEAKLSVKLSFTNHTLGRWFSNRNLQVPSATWQVVLLSLTDSLYTSSDRVAWNPRLPVFEQLAVSSGRMRFVDLQSCRHDNLWKCCATGMLMVVARRLLRLYWVYCLGCSLCNVYPTLASCFSVVHHSIWRVILHQPWHDMQALRLLLVSQCSFGCRHMAGTSSVEVHWAFLWLCLSSILSVAKF